MRGVRVMAAVLMGGLLVGGVLLGGCAAGPTAATTPAPESTTTTVAENTTTTVSVAQTYIDEAGALGTTNDYVLSTVGEFLSAVMPNGNPVVGSDGKLVIPPDIKAKVHDAAQKAAASFNEWSSRPSEPPLGFEVFNQKLLAYLKDAATYMNHFDIGAQTGDPQEIGLGGKLMQTAAAEKKAAWDELQKVVAQYEQGGLATTTTAPVASAQLLAGWTKHTSGGAEIYLPPAFDLIVQGAGAGIREPSRNLGGC